MPTQQKQYCFWLVNVIITTTLVVIKTQFNFCFKCSMEMTFIFFGMADSTKMENNFSFLYADLDCFSQSCDNKDFIEES